MWWVMSIIGVIVAYMAWEERQTLHFLGNVIWPGNDLLPGHANYRVSLVDLTIKGAPLVIASVNRSLKDGGQAMPFDLSCHRNRLKADSRYGFWAEIVAGDKVIYNSGLAQLSDLAGNKALAMPVQPMSSTVIVPPPSLHNVLPQTIGGTSWRVQTVAGSATMDSSKTLIEIQPNGQLAGRVAGYGFFAEAAFEGSALRVVALSSGGFATQLDQQEEQNRLFQSLFATTRFDLQGRKLSFFDVEGQPMLTMEPQLSAEGETLH
jgi:uncharacterized lipoprotein YbaY